MAKKNMTQLARKALLRRGRALLRLRQEVLARTNETNKTNEAGKHTEADYLIGLSPRERRELEDIHAALERIERGVFGECVDCGNKVEPSRIETLAYQRLCAACEADPLPDEVAEPPAFLRA